MARALASAGVTAVFSLAFWTLLPMLWGWTPMVVTSGSMGPLVRAGDVILAGERPGTRVAPGTVVVVDPARPGAEPVTHRVVAQLPDGRLRTQGDANPAPDAREPRPDQVRVVRLVVPVLGLARTSLGDAWPEVPAGLAGLALGTGAFLALRRTRGGARHAAAGVAVALALPLALTPHADVAARWNGTTTNPQSSWATKPVFYAQQVLALGPVSYYRMGGTSATTLVDTMGVANGTFPSGPPVRGRPGALKGDADTATSLNAPVYAQMPNVAQHSITTSMTALAWVKVTTAQTGLRRILIKWDNNTVNYLLAFDNTGTEVRFLADIGSGRPVIQAPVAVNGTWQMVAGVYDQSLNQLRFYVNGVAAATPVSTSGVPKTVTTGLTLSGSSSQMTGDLDEVAIWNRALTAAEIQNLYTLGTT